MKTPTCSSCVTFRRIGGSSLYGVCHIGEIETTHVATEPACAVYSHFVDAQLPPLPLPETSRQRRPAPRRLQARDRNRFRGDLG